MAVSKTGRVRSGPLYYCSRGAKARTFETSSEAAPDAGAAGMASSAVARLRRIHTAPNFKDGWVPFNLDIAHRKSYMLIRQDAQAVVAGQLGGEERFGTAELCLRTDGVQALVALISRGGSSGSGRNIIQLPKWCFKPRTAWTVPGRCRGPETCSDLGGRKTH